MSAVVEFAESLKREFRWGKPLTSYRKVQLVIGSIMRNRRSQIPKALRKGCDLLNVGCGPNGKDHFINLDYHWRKNVDLCWDLKNGLPLPSQSLRGIYSEHCLEHIEFDECLEVLTEFFRTLKSGGVARIVVPDAEIYLDLYQAWKKGDRSPFPYVDDEQLKEGFSPIMSVNRVFRNHGHRYCYDASLLTMMLKRVGFREVKKVDFREGAMDELLIDTPSRRVESLYLEAYK